MRLLCFGMICILTIGCQGDRDQFVPYPLDGHISELIDKLTDEPQSFTIPAGTSLDLKIDKTFELVIDSESFESETEINLEWSNPSNSIQMELRDLPNYSNGKYLSPSYAFNLSNDDGVEIDRDNPLYLLIESNFIDDLVLFHLTNEGWSELDKSGMIVIEWTDVNGTPKSGYRVTIENFGWYSLSTKVELSSETLSSFCIELSGEYTQANSKSFVIIENDIAVPMIRSLDQGMFCTSMNIPNGQPLTVISMSNLREGQFELYFEEVEMENGLVIAPVMEKKTIEEIKFVLENI